MTRTAGLTVVFALTTVAACGVGDDGGTGPDTQQPPKIDDGQVCDAQFTITGTFAPGTAPRPLDPDTGLPITACWPVGTWSFTAAVSASNCSTPPTVLPQYSFKVDLKAATDGGNDFTQVFTNTTSVGDKHVHVLVSQTGQGCEGSLELGSADGKDLWNMKPLLSKDPTATTLSGHGEYAEFKEDAWPFPSP
jgi:hypothetical protein